MASELTIPASGRYVGEIIMVNGYVRLVVTEIANGLARLVQDGPEPNRKARRAFDRAARRNRRVEKNGATAA